ncbi:hypothetical protein V7S43_001541 [Phytophthora oleae]|uniref:Uncharacterized protein n=1 Tax=Phytophthora oleae TaxID=2107226 RepID=A0ABD3G4H4_9STRA
MKTGQRDPDFLDFYWDGTSVAYCINQTCRIALQAFEQLCLNFKAVFRPLKAAVTENLEFVRLFNPDDDTYEGLGAGITADGVLCGVCVVSTW